MATFDNALSDPLVEAKNADTVQTTRLLFQIDPRKDVGTVNGRMTDGSDVHATFVPGDGNSFIGGKTHDQIIALGDRTLILDAPTSNNETLVGLGDNDILSASGSSSMLFALGINDALIGGNAGGDILVGNGTITTNLQQDRPDYTQLSEVTDGGSGNDIIFSSLTLFDQITNNGDTTIGASAADSKTFRGGAGNDTIFASSANPSEKLFIDGGDGKDVVDFSKDTAAVDVAMS